MRVHFRLSLIIMRRSIVFTYVRHTYIIRGKKLSGAVNIYFFAEFPESSK